MPPVTAQADDLALALELADIADEITLSRYRAEDLVVSTKPDLTPVSEADTAAEQAIRARLAEARPDDALVGEEYGTQAMAPGGRRWIIDPIDGTKNYVRAVPVWATLLALEDAGEGTVAVVSAPALGLRWWASRGEGAYARDSQKGDTRRIRVSEVDALEHAQLSFAGGKWFEGQRQRALVELAQRCARARGFGDFWAYMLVAEGSFELALDAPGVSLWDLAAPKVIVEEAGGRFTDLSGTRTADGGEAMASNGLVHDAALAILGD